ncbi:MAG TPA: amidase, partial [Thermoanaerobaculia bacterium]|nr:amidase [Thermoanaerobaculia bacterium]
MSDALDRRRFLTLLSAAGAVPAVLAAQNQDNGEKKESVVTAGNLAGQEKVIGLELSDTERDLMANGLAEQLEDYRRIRTVTIDNGVPPALEFDPLLPGARVEVEKRPFRLSDEKAPAVSQNPEELAYLPVTQLSRLVRDRRVTSAALTRMYLARLKRLDPVLHAVISFTEERALEQAEQADKEIAAGRYRGPLHGIPWGAKDLLAVKGYRTTWGSVPFKEQMIDLDAAVVERLDKAGAVLIAKLTLGELAWGDVWFGGMTRNPWN